MSGPAGDRSLEAELTRRHAAAQIGRRQADRLRRRNRAEEAQQKAAAVAPQRLCVAREKGRHWTLRVGVQQPFPQIVEAGRDHAAPGDARDQAQILRSRALGRRALAWLRRPSGLGGARVGKPRAQLRVHRVETNPRRVLHSQPRVDRVARSRDTWRATHRSRGAWLRGAGHGYRRMPRWYWDRA